MTSPKSTTKRVSAAEARRRSQAQRARVDAPAPLNAELQAVLDGYRPLEASDADWQAVRETMHWVMRRSGLTGATSFTCHCSIVTGYLLWRHRRNAPVAVAEAFTFAAVDEYFHHGMSGLGENTRQSYRSKLMLLAPKVNPSVEAPPRAITSGHVSVKPGYTDAELAGIRRVVTRLPSPAVRRQLCAIVGLCAGAGLGPEDLRYLKRCHIDDRGVDGIIVNVPGNRSRRTVVRADFEDMVRSGIEGLGQSSLVLGRKVNRRNVTANLIDGAPIFENIPEINAARLRSTWILHQMTRRVPLSVLIEAAGLASARTLTDLLAYLPETTDDPSVLREGDAA